MTVQMTYPRGLEVAYPGAIVGLPRLTRSGANASARHVETLTIGAPANSTLYTVNVNGIPSTFTSDASASEAEINAGLLAAIAANPFLAGLVTAAQGATTATIVVTAVKRDVRLTVTVSGGALARATTVAGGKAIPTGTFAQLTGMTNRLADVAAMSAANNTIAGVLSQSQEYLPAHREPRFIEDAPGSAEGDGLLPGSIGNFVRDGEVYVRAEEAMLVTSDVFVRFVTTAANPILGAVRTDNDGGNAVQLSSAVVHDYDASTGLVLLNPGLH